jgi:D-amino peptidase
MKRLALVSVVVSAVAAIGGQRPLKVLVLYDMEGVSGATDYRHTSYMHTPEYTEGRKSLTADVNAAAAGLKAAGATEIVVVDGHGSGNATGPDVIEEQLLAPAKMHYQDTPFDIYMDSYDQSFDAIVAVGMHAGAGNRQGFLSHTYTFEDVEYKVNGVPFNESMVLAHGAARLKIPVVAVSGDDQLEKEIRRNLPWAQYATVKHAVSKAKAEAFARDDVSRRIETAARDGLAHLQDAKLPEMHGPYRFALTFQDEAQARNAAMVPGTEILPGGTSVQYVAGDFEEGYRKSVRLISMASAIGRATAMQAVVGESKPNGDLRIAVTDWLYSRFLQGMPRPQSSAASQPARYWGARD